MKHLFPDFLLKTLQLGLMLALNFLCLYAKAQIVVFSEDFEQWTTQSPSLPPGWILGGNSCNTGPACYWSEPQNFPIISRPDTVGCEGTSNYARGHTAGMIPGSRASMISPSMDLSLLGGANDVHLDFCMINPSLGIVGTDGLELFFSSDGGQNWVIQLQDAGTYDMWTTHNVDIPLSFRSNNFRVRFDAISGGDQGDIGIDELKIIQESPSCMAGSSTVSSSLSGQICRNNEIDIAILSNDDTSNASYDYILTDNNDRILGVLPSTQIDLNFLPVNTYRIYGISYSGTLDVDPGLSIQTARASLCYALSSNYSSFFLTDLDLESQVSDYNGYQVSIAGGQDGSIEIISPANSNYVYNWSHDSALGGPIQTQLGEGSYQIMVTDPVSGCTDRLSVELVAPAPLVGLLEITTDYQGFPLSCFNAKDASLKASVQGGVKPYRYVWQGSPTIGDSVLSNIGAGRYILSVIDQNGALIHLEKEVVAPEDISVLTERELFVCFGDNVEIALEVIGGTGAYTYLWANGSTDSTTKGQGPGNTSVRIQDANGCSKNFSLEIKESTQLQVDPIVSSPQCSGKADGSILLFPSGGIAPYTFLWSNGSQDEDLLDLAAGSYEVTLTDDTGCKLIQSFGLEDPAPLAYTLELFPDNGPGNGAARIVVEGGTAPYIFTWSHGATGPEQSNLTGGPYSVVLSDASGCSELISFEIEIPNGPSCADIHMGFSPNGDGINDKFVIPCLDIYPDNELQIVNRWGQELFYTNSYANDWEGTSYGKALAEGTYFYVLRINGPDGKRIFKGSVSIIK